MKNNATSSVNLEDRFVLWTECDFENELEKINIKIQEQNKIIQFCPILEDRRVCLSEFVQKNEELILSRIARETSKMIYQNWK